MSVLFLIYICLAIGGFAIMAFSFLLGGGHDGDHAVDHADGHEPDLDHDLGGMESVIEGDHDSAAHQIHWFSTKVLSAFLSFFGSSGAIFLFYNMRAVFSFIFSLTIGLAAGYLMNLLLEFLLDQQCTSSYRAESLIGRTGRVLIPIGPGKIGEIEVECNGRNQIVRARSIEGSREVVKNEHVTVTGISGGPVLLVKPEEP